MTPAVREVSVVIPCWNAARYLASSVRSAREQSHPPVEVIVVDDGSTDDSAAVAESLDVVLLRQPNGGVSRARNAGLRRARAPFVVFLDADDELLADALASGIACLMRWPQAGCAVGRTLPMDAEGRPLPHGSLRPPVEEPYRALLAENIVSTPGAAMFRREALEAAGGFPEDVGPAADYAVYLRLARDGRLVDHGRPLVRYRHHSGGMSRDTLLMLRVTMEVLRRERACLPARYEREFARGRARWRRWYGEQLLEEVAQDWRLGRFRRSQLRALTALVRHCPSLVARRVVSRLSRTASRTSGGSGGAVR